MHNQIRLRFAGYAPADSVYSQAARQFKQLVEQGTGGRVVVDLFWNVLDFGYSAEQLIQMVEAGLLAGMYMSTSYLADAVPALALFDLPFLVDRREQAYRLMDGEVGNRIAEQLEARTGLKHLGYWENGFRHISNRVRPVQRLEDLEGLRIRLQPNAMHERVFGLLGAVPVRTDVSGLTPAFERGELDGQENPLDNIWLYGVHRFTPYLTLTAHLYGVRGMYLNRAWFEQLRPGDREAVVGAGLVVSQAQRGLAQSRDAAMLRRLREVGLQVVELTERERARFRERVRPVYAETAEALGQDILDQTSAVVD
jgi:tripartite ATP-independent transporter DctP family solute receptor